MCRELNYQDRVKEVDETRWFMSVGVKRDEGPDYERLELIEQIQICIQAIAKPKWSKYPAKL